MTIMVEASIYEGLQAVLENDELNEYHHTNTRKWLFSEGYYPAAGWIGDNPSLYSDGLRNGFEVKENEE